MKRERTKIMKKLFYRLLSCAVLLCVATVQSYARDGIIATRHYNLCPGDTISFDGVTKIFNDTIIRDTVKVSSPTADSIYVYVVNIGVSYSFTESREMEVGQTFIWHNRTISKPGTYIQTYKSQYGCDSTYTLTVTERYIDNSEYHFEQSASMCEGDSYTWPINGITYTDLAPGTYDYYKGMQTVSGNDSIYHLTLTVYPIVRRTEMVKFVSFPASYRGYQFSEGESHDFIYKTSNGCDSIVTVIANKYDLIEEEQATICAGDYYEWRNRRLTTAGTYQDVEKTKDGLNDSIYYRLTLTVRDYGTTNIAKTICRGSSFTFGGVTYTETGVYSHTYLVDGCDSTIVLTLNVLDVDTIIVAPHLTEGTTTYTWAQTGETYNVPGIYDTTLTNQNGCDSIVRLVLYTDYIDTIDTTATICPGETLYWHGITGRETKTYERFETQSGNKILYRLNLTVLQAVEVPQTITLCAGETATFNGKTYSEAGTYFDKYSCDTTYRITVVKHPTIVHVTNATWDGQGTYNWIYMHEGQQETVAIDAAGTYNRYHDNSETGCKETYRLILTLDDTEYHFLETITICEGDDFSWRGRTNLSRQGIGETTSYFDNFQTVTGQDSIYELQLTVKPAVRTVRTEPFCGQIVWKGQTYTESIVVYDTLVSTQYGCDSIVRINFDKSQSYYFHDTATITQGEILFWHGLSINTDGLFRDPHTTVNGCDSIYELGVGIIAATPHSNTYTTVKEMCDGDVFEWRGRLYYTSGTYVDSIPEVIDPDPAIAHPDSIFVLKLTVWPESKDTVMQHLYSCGGGAIRYNGQDYTQNDTVITTFSTIHGCDSIVKVFLHFNTASFITDTLRIADNDTTRFWHEQKINHAGTYRYEELVEGGCYNREELVVFTYPTFTFTKDTAICQNETPYHWLDGPQDKVHLEYTHPAGETKTYEHKYTTVDGFDSIYQLTLTIYPIYELHQQVYICEGESYEINGKTYFNLKSDSLYRDTTLLRSANNCDSVVYTEIYQYPTKYHTETVILRKDSTITWKGRTITSGGTYTDKQTSLLTGCDSINKLVVIEDDYKTVTICQLDTPYVWRGDSFYTSGVWHDTVYYNDGRINTFHTLDLTVNVPVDTVLSLRGCLPQGVTFNDKTYFKDTTVTEVLHTCDTIYTLHINVDTTYTINIVDTICEHELPYILGRQNPNEIWSEGFYTHKDITACGCDSTINLTLRIIPSLAKTDSTFLCEDEIKENPVVLGNLVNPAFTPENGGQYTGTWQGKWKGVSYHSDTIVYNCDSSYSHHIIVRPSQKMVKDTTFFLCPDDSIRIFWGRGDDSTWFYKDTTYYEHVPMPSTWTDNKHHYSYANDAYTCDSVTIWHIKVLDRFHKDTTAHRLLGDSIWWGGAWRYYTGTYDSIAQAPDTNSLGDTCIYIYPLHLIMDTAYYFRDTVDFCAEANTTYSHIWPETGYKQDFTVGNKDSIAHHFIDSLVTYDRRDSIYDLCVNYHLVRHTTIYDTICEGTSRRFDIHHRNNSVTERYLTTDGTYTDTVTATSNGCDSIITLYLKTRDRIPVTHKTDFVTDRDLPYLWQHTWKNADGTDTTYTDTLYTTVAENEYRFVMPSIHGCDSVDSLHLTMYKTHVYRDTIDICAPINKTLIHEWPMGYRQEYTTPLGDDSVTYADTLATQILYDSIYVLLVNFHQTYLTERLDTICEGERFRFDTKHATEERWLDKAGTYWDTIPTRFGCDSVIQLRLFVRDRVPVTHTTVHIPDTAAPYLWKHTWARDTKDSTQILYATGEYEFRMPNIYGCDSIDSLHLFIHPTYNIREDTITICQNETPFTWQDRDDIITSGDYTFHTLTVDGYDSTRVVYIEVRPILRTQLRDTLCYGQSMQFGLTKYNKPRFLDSTGVYYDTLTSYQYGCDSIIELTLNVYPNFHSFYAVDIVDTQLPFVWSHIQGGDTVAVDTLRGSGEFTYRFITSFGCDSIDSLSLRVFQTYNITDDTINICSNETPYTWHDYTNITETGDYIYHGQTVDHQDSIHSVHINVWPVQYTTLNHSMCAGGVDFFGNKQLSEGGTYYDTLTTAHGCDSIVTLILTVHQPFYTTRTEHIVEGNEVHFFDTICKTSGTYYHYGKTPEGCDSTYVLTLVVHPQVDTTVTVCSTDLPYTWVNKWNGQETLLYASGIYRNDTTYVNGERMFYGLELIVNLPKDTTISRTICSDGYYQFNGQNLNIAGEYRDTLVATNGCDSIVKLHLNVIPISFQREEKTIFEGDSILFYGTYYKEGGTYTHREDNGNQCYNTHELVLSILREVHNDTTSIVCDSDLPYIWHGVPYNEAGDYDLRTTWTDSSHVVTTLHLIVNPTMRREEVVDLCQGNTFVYKGKEYSENGSFSDTIPTMLGCDSIIRYIIRVHPTFNRYDTIHISDKQTYDFNGRTLKRGGDYVFSDTTKYGCDSIHHLHLVVHPSYFFYDSIDLCKPDTIHWHGMEISQSGLYTDSLLTERYGFDSVYHIRVNVHDSYFIKEKYEIVPGYTTKIHGIDISIPGIYYDTLTSIHGCDSIYQIVVNSKRTIEVYKRAEICFGDYYEFYDQRLAFAGNYSHTTEHGDSIIYLELIVHPASITIAPTAYVSQEELPYVREGRMYPKGDTVYIDTLKNQYLCDSIIRFQIVIAKHLSPWYALPLCPGSEIKIDGETITQAGLYTFPRRSKISGAMDSLYRVEVFDVPSYDYYQTLTICDGDTVYYGDRAITREGHYDITFPTVYGCDSTYHVDLTVNPSYHFIEEAATPDYKPYVWYGRTYHTAGTYDRTWASANDCDSTHTLDLEVIETRRDTVTHTICNGQTYFWRDKQYTDDGFYTDTVWRPESHFSAIYVLRLIIAYPTHIISAKTGDVCADAEGFDVTFEYEGQKPTHYSIYFDALAKREGFVDVIDEPLNGEMVAHVVLPQFSSLAYENHTYYVRPDNYSMRLALDNGVCGISRSDSIPFLVKYPSWILEQNWSDVVAPLKADYNGGFEFSQTEWFINGVRQNTGGTAYLYNKELRVGDQVVMNATRKGENYSIPTCPLVIVEPGLNTHETPVIVYPTQAPKYLPVITIEAPRDGKYEIYSSTGMLFTSGNFSEGATQVTLPAVSGIYFIRTQQGDETQTHKVLLY